MMALGGKELHNIWRYCRQRKSHDTFSINKIVILEFFKVTREEF